MIIFGHYSYFKLFTATWLTYYILRSTTTGQYLEDPNVFFVNMSFNAVQRGSFAITPCVKELLNCWEVINPETLCMHVFGEQLLGDFAKTDRYYYDNNTFHGSVCDVMKQYCHDVHGDQHDYTKHWFKMEKKILDLHVAPDCVKPFFT